MAKRRYRRRVASVARRVRRYSRRARRAYSKPKIPLEVAVMGLSIPFVAPCSGYATPFNAIMAKNPEMAFDSLRMGFIGMDAQGNFDWFRTLNPFDMERARYTKSLVAAGLVSRIRKRFVKIPMNKVPFVGRYIS